MALEWARLLPTATRQEVRIPCGSASQCFGHEDKCEDVVSDHGCDANQVDGVEASDGV